MLKKKVKKERDVEKYLKNCTGMIAGGQLAKYNDK